MTITNAAGCPVACPIEVVHWVLPVAIFNYLLPGTVTPTSCQPDGPCWLDQYCEDISGNFAYRSFVPTRQLLNVFTSCIQRVTRGHRATIENSSDHLKKRAAPIRSVAGRWEEVHDSQVIEQQVGQNRSPQIQCRKPALAAASKDGSPAK